MKRHQIKVIALLLCLGVILSSCVGTRSEEKDGVLITDMLGRAVVVPEDPKSICVLDAFAAPAVVMLGYGDRMPSTINAVSRNLLLQSISQALESAVVVKTSGSVNAEMILKLNTDLVIIGADMYASTDERAKLDTLGIPYIVLKYDSMEEQMAVVTLLGQALEKEDVADRYVSYYENCIDRVSNGVSALQLATKMKLYHSVNEAARTDYPGSLGADWIGLCGVQNVSLDTQLNMTEDKAYATLEQIYSWDPDIIIANESGVADYILTDNKWQGLHAVISGDVYQIPIGLSRWGHPTSIETPLAILWLAELLYPDVFDINIRDEMTSFYQTFFGYAISEAEADSILSGYDIRTPKTLPEN